ncbi:putative non-specific serine/threonine protein kinase [Rosa chinensis]|uniref:Putative non-specific serine/threonine protein kinase n=1 Tax=Rosa chinensis TaxID=74649 RepID=A0A2P6RDT5_ROSCH|nr:putative non-specific serine/threonine protein kinase [Rosa chinensis]
MDGKGGPTNSSTPLPWAARLKIAQGSARGLTYIHEHSPRKYVPGNIKSTKILLNEDLQPYVSGFGLARLILGSSKFLLQLPGKRAPAKPTQPLVLLFQLTQPFTWHLRLEFLAASLLRNVMCTVLG